MEMGGGNKDKSYLGGIPLARTSGERLTVSTSIYAVEIQAALHGFDTDRFLKSMLGGITSRKRKCWDRNENSVR